MGGNIRVTVWNEFRHERVEGSKEKEVYPEGIHAVIADGLKEHPEFDVRSATLDEPEHGLTEEVLKNTDVLTWWGHMAHDEVDDAVVERVQERIVLGGMGRVVLHSGHFSKISRLLTGTTCNLSWREAGEKERVWVVEPGHPIAEGLSRNFDIPQAEMYGERFDIPAPDELVFVSWFKGGEVFRSGCCFRRGNGRIFYFRPGHESYPIYFQKQVRQVLANGVRWAAPREAPPPSFGHKGTPLEPIA